MEPLRYAHRQSTVDSFSYRKMIFHYPAYSTHVLLLVESFLEMALQVGDGGRRETRWCAVTGGRGFMARHLVAALLRSGEWRVRVTDLATAVALEPAEEEGLLGVALRDGRAVYASADVCDTAQLTKGTLCMSYQVVVILLHGNCWPRHPARTHSWFLDRKSVV